ncbi:MAG: hypothetical protein GEU28_11400 [Dehalococcoidia bacterium]|nr:hypothetical protein [Dehalococcoidia bacterium]
MGGARRGTAPVVIVLAVVWAIAFMVSRAAFSPVGEASHCGVPHDPGEGGYQAAYQPHLNEVATTFERASANQLYGGAGAPWWLYNIERGPRGNRSPAGAPYVPPTLLKATGFVESSWFQADYDTARGSSGPPLVSFDCGYGIMQMTNALGYYMGDSSDPNGVKRNVAVDYQRNIAIGANVLIDKWNAAPEFRPVVGAGNPSILEDWYYAIWSYNGWAASNDPNSYPSTRPEYRCDGLNYTAVPYQERVVGCMRNPAQGLWSAIPVTYRRTLPAFVGCTGSCDTSSMDIPTPQPHHTEGGGGGGGDTTPPRVTVRRTLDRNANGHIDAIELRFNERVNDRFGGLRVAVGGYCDSDPSTLVQPCRYHTGGVNNNRMLVIFGEKRVFDTARTPRVRILSNQTLADAAGNLVRPETVGRIPADGAGPALVGARTVSRQSVEMRFSEKLSTPSVQKWDFVLIMRGRERLVTTMIKRGPTPHSAIWRLRTGTSGWSPNATGSVRFSSSGAAVTDFPGNWNIQVSFVRVRDGFP